ncbi:hypothetical protein DYB32_008610 [Aphanomyces invadans]|uniref:FAD-binding FR-type domain-containing protein n=1 Tax=Aphanomyces invadans TaxID=157072 RepID=A0A3R6V5E3_9STRA|nr:hypothetical protein DYB32_008610 [Aphanomyces invadans]
MDGDSTHHMPGASFEHLVALTPTPPRVVGTRSSQVLELPKLSKGEARVGWTHRYVHNRRQAGALALYGLLCGLSFWWKCSLFPWEPLVGYGMCIAKGSAQVVVVNCCVALLLLSRSILHFIKAKPFLWRIFPLEDHMVLHKISGGVMCLSALVHTSAHVANLVNTYSADPTELQSSYYVRHIPLFLVGLPPFGNVVRAIPMWTGIVLLVLLFIALPPSLLPSVRRRFHNVFWCTHLFLIPFLIVTCFHGATGWFQMPQAFLWIVPPLVLYVLERRLRYFKRWTTPVLIHEAKIFPDAIAMDLIKPPEFSFVPGMFVYLNVPVLGRHEWHPFSISSAPDDPHLSFRIQAVGDWTIALLQRLQVASFLDEPWPLVHLDGPVGGPTVECRRFQVVVLIGGGSGVTPFVSVVRDFLNCPPLEDGTKKMYFHWVTRHESAFEWFDTTLRDLNAHGHPRLDARLYVTQPNNEVEQAAHHHQFRNERPRWVPIFDELERDHPEATVGVFYCGPHALEVELRAICRARHKATFHFYAESYY